MGTPGHKAIPVGWKESRPTTKYVRTLSSNAAGRRRDSVQFGSEELPGRTQLVLFEQEFPAFDEMLAKGFQIRLKFFGRFVGIGFDRQRAEFYLVLKSLARAVND